MFDFASDDAADSDVVVTSASIYKVDISARLVPNRYARTTGQTFELVTVFEHSFVADDRIDVEFKKASDIIPDDKICISLDVVIPVAFSVRITHKRERA